MKNFHFLIQSWRVNYYNSHIHLLYKKSIHGLEDKGAQEANFIFGQNNNHVVQMVEQDLIGDVNQVPKANPDFTN